MTCLDSLMQKKRRKLGELESRYHFVFHKFTCRRLHTSIWKLLTIKYLSPESISKFFFFFFILSLLPVWESDQTNTLTITQYIKKKQWKFGILQLTAILSFSSRKNVAVIETIIKTTNTYRLLRHLLNIFTYRYLAMSILMVHAGITTDQSLFPKSQGHYFHHYKLFRWMTFNRGNNLNL